MEVKIHPLVIINISDHFTRTKVNQGKDKVIGALMGIQTGRSMEIMTSFEAVFDDSLAVNAVTLKDREDQLKTVFPDYDILGWYCTGKEIASQDIELHKSMCAITQSPLILAMMDINPDPAKRDLPISIYEPQMVNEQLEFQPVAYKIETTEPERVSVDGVAKMGATGSDGVSSNLVAHLRSMKSAVQMLSTRIEMLLAFLRKTHAGELARDHTLLRQIASVTNRLPVMTSTTFDSEYMREYLDGLLVTYMTAMTTGLSVSNSLVDKFAVAFERRGGRGHHGFFPDMM